MDTPFCLNPIAPLKKGDTIAIISTARKISINELQPGIQWMEGLGFKVLLGKTIEEESYQFAGTDAARTADLQAMIDNKTVKAIWCARGGYGTVRIIDNIDFSSLKKQPKYIIGYSDITVLHSHLHTLDMTTVHAPMAFDISKATVEAQESFKKVLLGKATTYSFPSTRENIQGKAQGMTVGGNLSILYSLCGSASAINTKGKILFLEDLDEYLYHIDRMLQNLDRNGMFKDLAGLVIGAMSNMHDNIEPFGYTVTEMILEITAKYNYPVVFDAPFGHIADNRAVVLGKEMTLSVNEDLVTVIQ